MELLHPIWPVSCKVKSRAPPLLARWEIGRELPPQESRATATARRGVSQSAALRYPNPLRVAPARRVKGDTEQTKADCRSGSAPYSGHPSQCFLLRTPYASSCSSRRDSLCDTRRKHTYPASTSSPILSVRIPHNARRLPDPSAAPARIPQLYTRLPVPLNSGIPGAESLPPKCYQLIESNRAAVVANYGSCETRRYMPGRQKLCRPQLATFEKGTMD